MKDIKLWKIVGIGAVVLSIVVAIGNRFVAATQGSIGDLGAPLLFLIYGLIIAGFVALFEK